jgi:parallel beta-helix repeat protein
MKRLLIVIAVLSALPALSATYYVDCEAPDDRAPGTSPENAWKTIDKVNRSYFLPGDFILFKRGCTWREQLGVIWSGFAASPITFGAYGNGADPLLNGGMLVSGWVRTGTPNVWEAIVTTEPRIAFFDGTKGRRVTSQAQCGNAGEWHWASGILSVCSASDPNTAFTAPGIEVGYLDQVVWIGETVSYVALDGLSVQKSNGDNVRSYGTHLTFQNCESSWSAHHGIVQATRSGDNVISGCSIHDNGECGILTWKDAASFGHENYISQNKVYNNHWMGIYIVSNYYIIEYNLVHDNGNTVEPIPYGMGIGIEIFNGDNDGFAQHNIVRYNRVFGQRSGFNDGTGINADDFSKQTIIYGNVVTGCDGPGIGVWRASDVTIYNNTCYGNNVNSSGTRTTMAEIAVGASSAGEVRNITIMNNVARATEANTYAVYVDANSYRSPGLNISNNCWYAEAPNWYYWNTNTGNSLAMWNALAGAHAELNADPLFTDPTGEDLSLQEGSPCIDAGADLGSSDGTAIRPGSSWPENVLTGEQRGTGVSWDIGAYLFPADEIVKAGQGATPRRKLGRSGP